MSDDNSTQLRWTVYLLLIAVAVGNMAGRLLAVDSVDMQSLQKDRIHREILLAEQQLEKKGLTETELHLQLAAAEEEIRKKHRYLRPCLSANDRSRWLAIRALVEQGTYAIEGVHDRQRWNTIDMVQHRGRDGELHLYSSKPPLLITLLAGQYWLIHQATGMTLEENTYTIVRLMLITTNILPMVLMFTLLTHIVERFGTSDWGRLFTVAAGTLGTFLTTFAVVLNNHIVGAVSATVALYAFLRIWCDGDHRLRYYLLAGCAAAFTAANELPALAFFALIALALFSRNRGAWLVGFAPAAAMVIVAFFATNYIAHNSLRPPYMHRSEDPADNWYRYTYTVDGVENESYWQNRQGIDRGEPSRADYALHVLVGHHGIFSLSPIWLLSMVGIAMWLWGGTTEQRQIALGVALLTAICLVFFIVQREQPDRNYGGMTSGFRWMFWFAPLWLTTMLPAADRLGRSPFGRALALSLLAMSVLSVSYPTWNPWTQPWIYDWMDACGWELV